MDVNKGTINRFFKEHMSLVLETSSVILSIIIIFFFAWGIMKLVQQVGDSSSPLPPGAGGGKFNIEEARSLDLRGLE